MKIGCCSSTEDLLLVQGQGYDYIELAASQLMTLTEKDFQAFLEQYRETGFPCRGFNSLCGAELPLVGPKQDLDALSTYMKALCRRGAALGIRNIGVGAPGARNPPPDWPEERSDRQMCEFLQMACETAAPHGIDILLEALNPAVCTYLCSSSHAAGLVRKLGCRNLGLVLDYYHVRLSGENPAELRSVMPLVRHIHVSGGEAGKARSFLTGAKGREELAKLHALAAEQGYTGDTVSVEADRAFLERDGEPCEKLLRMAWT